MALADVKLLGPLQLYVAEPVPVTPVALRFNVVPTHNGFGDALTLVIVGNAFTVTAVVTDVALVQPLPG